MKRKTIKGWVPKEETEAMALASINEQLTSIHRTKLDCEVGWWDWEGHDEKPDSSVEPRVRKTIVTITVERV